MTKNGEKNIYQHKRDIFSLVLFIFDEIPMENYSNCLDDVTRFSFNRHRLAFIGLSVYVSLEYPLINRYHPRLFFAISFDDGDLI
jgi:hypothetical protein